MIYFFHVNCLILKAFSLLQIVSDVNDEIMKYRAGSKLEGPVGILMVASIGSQNDLNKLRKHLGTIRRKLNTDKCKLLLGRKIKK